MLGNYLQQTTSADDVFRCIFFLALLLGTLRVKNTKHGDSVTVKEQSDLTLQCLQVLQIFLV